MDKDINDNKKLKKMAQPVIRMDYCSDGCNSCGESCEYKIDPTRSFWGWLKNKFSKGNGDKA